MKQKVLFIKRQMACLITLLMLSVTSFLSAQEATFEGLGFLAIPDGPFFLPTNYASGVSSDGSVVVGISSSEHEGNNNNVWEAYSWEDGEMTGLGDLEGGSFASQAFDISANGLVIVGTGSPESDNSMAVRWENGEMTELGILENDFSSRAYGVSEDGSVIAGVSYHIDGLAQAFRWEGGEMTGLGFLPGEVFSEAWGISDDGSVIVGSSGFSISVAQAVRWDNGEITALGTLPGGEPFAFATKISADGSTIIGGSHSGNVTQIAPYTEAFRIKNGVMEALGDLPGGDFISNAMAVSADGSIIAGYAFSEEGFRAFIWTEEWGMRNFQEFLEEEYDLTLTGWILDTVYGMSDDASVFIGVGINPDGNMEGFRVTLPEPLLFTDDLAMNAQISLYPNPTTGIINIQTKEKISSVSVYNSAGQRVPINSQNKENTSIDISNLPNGIYFVEVILNNDKTVKRYKVIKK